MRCPDKLEQKVLTYNKKTRKFRELINIVCYVVDTVYEGTAVR